MEDEPDVPELNVRRSKRARAPTKAFDGQSTRIPDVFDSDDDSGDEIEVRRRKPNRNHHRTPTEKPHPPPPSTSTAAAPPISFHNLIGDSEEPYEGPLLPN